MKEKVLVAMSGGVDSSVAALLLKNAGYDCVGATMKLFLPEDICGSAETCGSGSEADDARRIADGLGIPFSLLDERANFKACVMDYFVSTYLTGGTPNPCVQCNRTMKFGRLYEVAKEMGCEKIATGHYAKITKDANGRYLLSEASDGSKDQTYVLWALTQEQLSRTLFPLSGYTKTEVREMAGQFGFCNANRKDSQDICFVPDGNYAAFLEKAIGKTYPTGSFTDTAGNVLGTHRGMIHYTVGQRKGLGIAFGKPTFVCGKDAKTNTVVLGSNEDLFRNELTAHSVNLIAVDRIDKPMRIEAKIRYKAPLAKGWVEQTGPDTVFIRFDEGQRAIAPGQSVVFYDGDTVVGGGIID